VGTHTTHKYYIIADYAGVPDGWEYVSSVGDTPDDMWTTIMPYGYTGDDHKEPITFETKATAQRVLDMVKSARAHWWEQNKHYYILGERKTPRWKIYPV
jgi:hypothetical protein